MSEQQFVRSTAPTLAGLKTGSLFPFRYTSRKQAVRELRDYNRQLTPKGLRLLPLRMDDRFALLYLYRPGRLGEDLRAEGAAAILRKAGYPDCDETACLTELRRRLTEQADFPHEIGLFLGYPPEDVRAFMEHRNEGCKCVGCWRVYGDEETARRKFDQYERCTDSYLNHVANGCTLAKLTIKNENRSEQHEEDRDCVLERNRQHRDHGQRRFGGCAGRRRGGDTADRRSVQLRADGRV